MNRFRITYRTVVLVSLLLLASAPGVMAADYGWTLSLSDTDPLVNAGAALPGFGMVYLWMYCNNVDGAAAFGSTVTVTGGAFLAGFTPVTGVLNAGTATNPALAIGGCPDGPMLIGSFSVVGTATDMCMNTAITVDCNQITPTEWPSDVVGCSAGGGTVCEVGNRCLTPVEETSWGSLKVLYR